MIRMTRQADYAILLMSRFAGSEDGSRLSTTELTHDTGISLPMVNKTAKLLTRAGLLTSQRGVQGGYALARAAEAITLADIIASADGPIVLTECARGGGVCELAGQCPTRPNWNLVSDAIQQSLESISLHEMTHPLFLRAKPRRSGAQGASHV